MTTTQSVAPDDRSQAGTAWLLVATLLALIVLGYLLPVTGYFSAVPGGLGDARFNSVILEHLYRSLSGGPGVWNPEFFYPLRGALALSDNHFGSAATYLLARLLGLSREHAFDAWFVAGTLLNFPAAFYVIRRLGLGRIAAALGAFFYTFCLPMIAWEGYAQLVHRFAAPLAVLALWEMFERRRIADLGRVAFFTAWQFYCSIYLGLFLAYLLVALMAGILIVRRPLRLSQWRSNLAAERPAVKLGFPLVLIGSGLALAWLVGTYYAIARGYGIERDLGEITYHLPRLGSYLLAEASPLWGPLGNQPYHAQLYWEKQMFVGAGALLLAIVGASCALRGRVGTPQLAKVMLIALLTLFVGTLMGDDELFLSDLMGWYQGSLAAAYAVVLLPIVLLALRAWRGPPASTAMRALWIAAGALALGLFWLRFLPLYHFISWLPGISGMRAVGRIILIMLVPLSILVALGVEAIWQRRAGGRVATAAILAGLTALLAVEPLTADTRSEQIGQWRARLEALRSRMPAALPDGAILFVRTGDRTFYPPHLTTLAAVELDAMMLGQELGVPVVNGYSGFNPPGYQLRYGIACQSGRERLTEHARLMGYDQRRIEDYLRRLVIVELVPQDC